MFREPDPKVELLLDPKISRPTLKFLIYIIKSTLKGREHKGLKYQQRFAP